MRGKIELRTTRNAGIYMNEGSWLNSRNSKAIKGGLANMYYPAVRKRR
jgi:hypothetical protein